MKVKKSNLRNLPLFLFDFVRLAFSAFADYYLKIRTSLSKNNPIGAYVGVCNKSEIRMMFPECIAGGYTGFVQIKIFALPNCSDCEECAIELLNHEILHQTLDKVIGGEAKVKLDKIHKPFCVLDCATNKWSYVIRFVHEKRGHITVY
jgi:hypothetical protein